MLTGCELKDDGDNLVNGKTLFVEKCARLPHARARRREGRRPARTSTRRGSAPSSDGLGRSTFEGVVHRQILQPNQNPSVDPDTGKELAPMPSKIVTGEDAQDVAAYVASAAAAPGKDSGRLATAGAAKQEEVAQREGRHARHPGRPGGRARYTFNNAEAPAGQLTINSKNDSTTPHDIAIEGGGVNEKGEIVKGGGTSTIDADLKAGEYTFYCSVPGHRAGGMEGKLTVK